MRRSGGLRRAIVVPLAVVGVFAFAVTAAAQPGLPPLQPPGPAPPPPAPPVQPAPPEPEPPPPAAPPQPPTPEPGPAGGAAQPPSPTAPPEPAPPPRTGAAPSAAPPPVTFEAPSAAVVDPLDWSSRARAHLGPLTLKPIVLVTAYATPYVGDDAFAQANDIAEQGGFRLRRARMGLDGDVDRKVRFAVTAQIGSEDTGEARIHDAWLGYVQFPFAQVYAGAHQVPFSRSAMTGSGDSALLERPFVVRAMAPEQQVGVHVQGHFWDEKLAYYGGVYNAFRRTDQFYAGYIDNYAPVGNRFGGLAYVGRLATEPLGPLGSTIEDVKHSPFRFGAGGGYFFSDGGARRVHSIGGDVLAHFAGLHLLGELVWAKSLPESEPTEPTAQTAKISSFGLAGEVGYMILARRLGVTARVEFIDPNSDVDDEGDNFVFTGGASWRILGNENLRLGAEYTHREELFGLVLENDSVTLGLQFQL